jgi:hypothetical protein
MNNTAKSFSSNNFNRRYFLKNKVRCIILGIFMGITFFGLFNMNVSALVYLNSSETSFDDIEELNVYVIKGASYFLKSYSSFLLLLQKVELAEIKGWEFNKMREYLKSAIINMENAIEIYKGLDQEVNQSKYDPGIIDKLKKFNYDNLQKENRLIKPIFDDACDYLRNGKIREIYQEMILRCNKILSKLNDFQKKLKSSMPLKKTDLWDLNQFYSQSLLFGQYVARVFLKIREN